MDLTFLEPGKAESSNLVARKTGESKSLVDTVRNFLDLIELYLHIRETVITHHLYSRLSDVSCVRGTVNTEQVLLGNIKFFN